MRERTRWYGDRERGQHQRIARVLSCGAETLQISCQSCGAMHERAQGCRCGLLCVRCRGAIAAEKRGKFLAARSEVVAEARGAGRLNPRRRGGAYSDKFLTLTIPRLADDTIARRIERVLDVWPLFLKMLNRYFRERAIAHVEWFRVIEWTPGESDGLGNPHLHVWLFAPYLEQAMLKELWRHALLLHGCAPDDCRHVIVDIRAMSDVRGGAQELIKYLTKDIHANGQKVPAELYAEVFAALDGRRQTQASKGFMARARKAPQACECGAALPRRVRRKPKAVEAPTSDPVRNTE